MSPELRHRPKPLASASADWWRVVNIEMLNSSLSVYCVAVVLTVIPHHLSLALEDHSLEYRSLCSWARYSDAELEHLLADPERICFLLHSEGGGHDRARDCFSRLTEEVVSRQFFKKKPHQIIDGLLKIVPMWREQVIAEQKEPSEQSGALADFMGARIAPALRSIFLSDVAQAESAAVDALEELIVKERTLYEALDPVLFMYYQFLPGLSRVRSDPIILGEREGGEDLTADNISIDQCNRYIIVLEKWGVGRQLEGGFLDPENGPKSCSAVYAIADKLYQYLKARKEYLASINVPGNQVRCLRSLYERSCWELGIPASGLAIPDGPYKLVESEQVPPELSKQFKLPVSSDQLLKEVENKSLWRNQPERVYRSIDGLGLLGRQDALAKILEFLCYDTQGRYKIKESVQKTKKMAMAIDGSVSGKVMGQVVELYNTPVADCAAVIEEITGLRVSIDPDLERSDVVVTLDMRKPTTVEFLDALCKALGAYYEVIGPRHVFIAPANPDRPVCDLRGIRNNRAVWALKSFGAASVDPVLESYMRGNLPTEYAAVIVHDILGSRIASLYVEAIRRREKRAIASLLKQIEKVEEDDASAKKR